MRTTIWFPNLPRKSRNFSFLLRFTDLALESRFFFLQFSEFFRISSKFLLKNHLEKLKLIKWKINFPVFCLFYILLILYQFFFIKLLVIMVNFHDIFSNIKKFVKNNFTKKSNFTVSIHFSKLLFLKILF